MTKEYSILPRNIWSFYEIHSYKKDDVTLELTNCYKYGSIILKLAEDDILPTDEFDSDNYTKENQYYIEETGDLEFCDIAVFSDDETKIHPIYDWMDAEYDQNINDYQNQKEFIEINGWEYISSRYYFETPIVEEK